MQIITIDEKEWIVEYKTRDRMRLRILPDGLGGIRRKAGMSQTSFAQALGISQSYLSKMEVGMVYTPQAIINQANSILSETLVGPQS